MVRDLVYHFSTASVTSVTLIGNQFDDAAVAMLLQLKEEKTTLTTLCGLKPDQTVRNSCAGD